jgi:hypothetical protein
MLLNTGGSYYYDIFGKTATCTTTIVEENIAEEFYTIFLNLPLMKKDFVPLLLGALVGIYTPLKCR